jgi:Putative prokaryotic signal transducing protein
MKEMTEEVPEIRLCDVSNEVEAALVVNLLREEDISARSDATAASPIFGGLPFESGHVIFVPSSQASVAREILARYPHFKNLKSVHEPDL